MESSAGEEAVRAVRRRALVRSSLLTVAAASCWLALVVLAIRLGTSARDGSGSWLLVVGAAVVAAACLFAALVLGSRVLAILQGDEPVRPRAGGHRAARR